MLKQHINILQIYRKLSSYPCRCTGPAGEPCFQCYSGQFCTEKEDALSCKLDIGSGGPAFQAEYWLNGSKSGDPCTTTLGHYR